MLIDMHSHIWDINNAPKVLTDNIRARLGDDRKAAELLSGEGLIKHIEEAGFDKALVLALADKDMSTEQADAHNAYVADQVRKSAGKLFAFCCVKPDDPQAVYKVKKYIEEDGFCGLKIHPLMQEIRINDERLFPLYEVMQEYRLPVLFHCSGMNIAGYRDIFANPIDVDDVANAYPELPVIMAHMGRIKYDEAITMMRKHKNVYGDISILFSRDKRAVTKPAEMVLERTILWGASTEKLMIGTDYPFYTQKEVLSYMNMIMEAPPFPVTLEEVRAVAYENGQKFCDRYGLLR